MRQPTRLNKRVIDALPRAGAKGKPYLVRDTTVRGLMLAVHRLGSKTWKVQRDLYRQGKLVKTVRTTIGEWPDMDVDRARTRAQEVIAQIKRGIDPNAPVNQTPDSVLNWTLERLYDEYETHMRKRERRELSIADMKYRLDKYLVDWKSRPIVSLTKAECRALHTKITNDVSSRTAWADGKRTANLVLKQLKWALNYAATLCEDHETFPSNPVSSVTMHKERSANRSLALDDLPEWWAKVHLIPNPLRRQMHILGLLSGLRPGTLVALRKDWINLDRRAIAIPNVQMKSSQTFDLPLSEYMCDVVRDAMTIGQIMFRDSPWLFPTRSKVTQKVITTQVWKEKTLPSETGHILRHTYRTIAETTTIPHSHSRLLINHALPGMDAVYVDKRQLFRDLLASQEIMTDNILKLCSAQPVAVASAQAA